MGGYNSGRRGGRPTVDDSLILNLSKLIRDRMIQPNRNWGGSLVWSNVSTGAEIGSVRYEARTGSDRGHLRLMYTTTNHWSGEKRHSDYSITLTTRPQPFGGLRWWFVCPRTGRLAAKLYLPNGAHSFASRGAYRLAYRLQRQSRYDRRIGQAFKLRRRLGCESGLDDHIEKPKWMRWRTYNRTLDKIERLEGLVDHEFMERFGKHLDLD